MKFDEGDLVTTTYHFHPKRVVKVEGPRVTCVWGSGNKTMQVTYDETELTLYRKG